MSFVHRVLVILAWMAQRWDNGTWYAGRLSPAAVL